MNSSCSDSGLASTAWTSTAGGGPACWALAVTAYGAASSPIRTAVVERLMLIAPGPLNFRKTLPYFDKSVTEFSALGYHARSFRGGEREYDGGVTPIRCGHIVGASRRERWRDVGPLGVGTGAGRSRGPAEG